MPYKDSEKQREFQRQHYKNNKDKYRKSLKNRRERNKKFAYEYKIACYKCGMKEKVCLDFHHICNKTKNVSSLICDATTIEKLQIEISKCEVICGNCHRKLHLNSERTDGSNWKCVNKIVVEKRRWFIKFINNSKCAECQETDSRCLEFHHLRDKRFKISYMLTSGHSLDKLKEEINKCDILCVNCHRKKHMAACNKQAKS